MDLRLIVYKWNSILNIWGFYHHKITPLWPLANGMVENFMRSINKLVKTARIEGKSWTQELFKFVRN